jgi:hypothetical protein
MADGLYALVQAAELLALPTEPRVESKRRLLEEFLLNPFLDDDIQGLALRAGMERTEVEKDIGDLCLDGLLKEAGQRGYALDLEGIGAEAVEAEETPGERAEDEETEAVTAQKESPSQMEELRESRPSLGLVLLRADGQPELVDEQAASWLGLAAEELNAAAFEAITGIDPGLMLGGAPKICFTLQDPHPLTVTLQSCALGDEPGVLIALQDAALHVEMAAIHAHVQEELFTRCRNEMVEPMLLIQQFLDDPDTGDLGQTRAAMEHINGFLEEFLLNSPGGGGVETAPADAS